MGREDLSRRKVLEHATTGATATAVLSSAAAADPTFTTPQKAARQTEMARAVVSDADLRDELIRRHASDVLTRLSEEGYLPKPTTEVLNTATFDRERTHLERHANWEGTASTTIRDDDSEEDVTLLMTSYRDNDVHVRLFTQPELDRSYAMVTEGDDDDGIMVKSDSISGGDVSPECGSLCYDYTTCDGYLCYGCGTIDEQCNGKVFEKQYDCFITSNCTCDCEYTGQICECEYDCGC